MTSKLTPGMVPGQWGGDMAAGVGGRVAVATGDTKTPAVPVGESTAKEFPWIASVFGRLGPPTAGGVQTIPVGTRLRFTRGPGGEPSFYNNTDRPVKIDEIRIYAMPAPFPVTLAPAPTNWWFQIGRHVGLRLFTGKKEYIRDYLPLWQFQTESNRVAESARFRGTFTFPTSYYINRGNAFQLKTRTWWGIDPLLCPPNVNPQFRSTNIDMAFGLQGSREGSDFPVKMMRQFVVATAGATPANPLYQIIPFNEGRDFSLTDVNITHMGFGIRDIASYTAGAITIPPYLWWSWVQCQFSPPQGPKWMDTEDWIPIWGLLDQPGPCAQTVRAAAYSYWDHSMIIHRPVTPYILNPREELAVELRVNIAMDYSAAAVAATPGWTETNRGVPIWCTMYGRQESLA